MIKWLDSDCQNNIVLGLLNNCMDKDSLEETLNLASVASIYKKGDAANLANYRPISLLCTVSKVMTRLIYNRLTDFLCKYELLSSEPVWFPEPQHAILEMTDRLWLIWDNLETPIGIFIDLSKAFDCIDH